MAAQRRGDFDGACVLLQAAVRGAAQLQHTRMEAAFNGCLGSALAAAGRVDEARQCLHTTLAHPSLADDPQQRALLLCILAQAEHGAGAAVAARTALDQALALAGVDEQAWSFELRRQLRAAVASVRPVPDQ